MARIKYLVVLIICIAIIFYSQRNCHMQLPEPFSFLFTWFAAVPLLLWLSFTITNLIVKDFLILVVRKLSRMLESEFRHRVL